jgi:hypothetical protein
MPNKHTERSDLFSILDELDPNTFSNGAVGLFGFDANLLEHNALCVRGASERRGFVRGSEETLLVVQVGPATLLTGSEELAGGVKTTGFASVCHF